MSDYKESDKNQKESGTGTVPKLQTVNVEEVRRHFNLPYFMLLKEKELSEIDSDDTEPESETDWAWEEESNDDDSKSKKDFLETNSESSKELKNYDATFLLEELSSDDEVYTIQFPDQLDLNLIEKNKIDLEGKVLIVDKGKNKEYSVDTAYDEQAVTCAMPSKQGPKLINLPIKGHVSIIREFEELKTVKSEERVKLKEFKKEPVPFPTDLKVRHPLLGADWEEYIARTNDILSGKKVKRLPDEEERMEALEKLLKKLKNSKKKDQDREHQEELLKDSKINETSVEEKKDSPRKERNQDPDTKEKSPKKIKVVETPVKEKKAIKLEKLITKLKVSKENEQDQEDHKEKLPKNLKVEELSVEEKKGELKVKKEQNREINKKPKQEKLRTPSPEY